MFVPDAMVFGREGDGWKQVTSELSYARSSPERFLSTVAVLSEMSVATQRGDLASGPELGRLFARIMALHEMSISVADALSSGRPTDQEAAIVKMLGTATEGDVAEFAGSTVGTGAPDDRLGRLRDMAATALLARPGFTLRGGTNEILRGVIARHTAVVLGLENVPGLATNRHCAAGLGGDRDRSRVHCGGHGSRRPGGWDREHEHDADGPQAALPGRRPATVDVALAFRDRGLHRDAGNAAGLNDAAAAVLLMDRDYAASNGFEPLAAIRSWAAVGVAPRRTGMAPIDAIPKALARASVKEGDVDLFEINEAFCSVPVAATRALGIDQEICNVNGSGCSLGHPIAATGASMVVTMVHELRRRGARLGCVSMCAGGGMGMAMVVEAL